MIRPHLDNTNLYTTYTYIQCPDDTPALTPALLQALDKHPLSIL